MNKNIKKTIAIALSLSFTPTLMPSVLNLGTRAVFAASSSGYITNITLETNKDNTVNVYSKSSYRSKYKLSNISDKAPTSLYAQVRSNVRKIKVTDIDFGTDCDNVKIYNGSTKIDLNEEINISRSQRLKIEAYSGLTLKETYTLRIEKQSSSSSSSDNYDDIYLDDLSLTYDSDDINFNFNKEKSSYDIDVENKVSYVKVRAKPDDEDYTVRIDGNTVTDDDSWTKKMSLSEGKNTFDVKIKDDNENERQYELNITRASSSTSSSSATLSNSSLATSLSEGWQQISGEWYFIAPDGSKQTGWQKVDGKWYYMNESGVMQTGWLKSVNGKSYYLNPVSNGYKGALISIA